jgi:hypothetical protein
MTNPETLSENAPDLLGLIPGDYVKTHPETIDQYWLDRLNADHESLQFSKKEIRESKKSRVKLRSETQKEFQDRIEFMNAWRKESLERNKFLDQRGILKLVPEEQLLGLIDQGAIIGLADHDRILYPAYQFDPSTKRPYEVIARLIELCSQTEDVHAWEPHMFFELPLIPLEGRTPAQAIYEGDAEAGIAEIEGFIDRLSRTQ